MNDAFFDSPILNSPYDQPTRHWQLDDQGQPTGAVATGRRRSDLTTPIPKAKTKRGSKAVQDDLYADSAGDIYDPTETINGIRSAVESWRQLPESQWQVTASTARLLRHWRTHPFANQKPFFCQVEAVETVIWLTEVAPKSSAQGRRFWSHLEEANAAANPELLRLALKLATGAGKTTVMAMLIAWHTINAVRHPNAKRYSKGFLIVAPGITIRDRLRVLLPSDAENYYKTREIVPEDMLMDLGKAKIVITNFHAFKKKDEISLNKVQQAALKTTPKPESDGAIRHRPFADIADDDLLDVGVPRSWLEAVRTTEEDSVDELFDLLPAEAAEALLDFATGGNLQDHIAPKAIPGTDSFAHPDAQRRFRQVEGLEELRAALDAPFEKWATFLHPAQRAPVDRKWGGPTRISGSAGTGKSIVAVHRAVHLAKDPSAKVLLTTFSERLADNLQTKIDLLTATSPTVRERITVRAIDQAANELYAANFGNLKFAAHHQSRAAIAAAKDAGLGDNLTAAFLYEEWVEVIDAWWLHEEGEYANVPRIGRKVRLGSRQRTSAWEVFVFVRDWLAKHELVTQAGIYESLANSLRSGLEFPFTHIVVDEAQDLSVAQARFLAIAGADRAEALFFTGDLGQRIFHLPFSWARLGLDIRGRSQVLKVCYRTSQQIRAKADLLLAPVITDQDGISDERKGTVSVFDGPEPTVNLFKSEDDEVAAVSTWLLGCVEGGAPPADLAVLVRGKGQLDRAQAAVDASGLAVRIMPMHDAKGLEFRGCAVMAVDDDVLPDPGRLAAVGDIADLEAVQDTERHLLYVAITRARDRLMISGINPGSEFLDDLHVA